MEEHLITCVQKATAKNPCRCEAVGRCVSVGRSFSSVSLESMSSLLLTRHDCLLLIRERELCKEGCGLPSRVTSGPFV